MKTFSLEAGGCTPNVFIDESKSLVEISGNSTLRDTNWFYSNLLKWIIAFNTGSSKTRVFNIKLKRINDSSSKWIGVIFSKLNTVLHDNNREINWYLVENSRRSLATGQMLKDKTNFSVNFVSQTQNYY
ncbi:MAG: SiaC family regulatory phosphoprotein [Bacteroidales bacterium]|nr:SiaC family regulatory phosphoprotein [Bacteroidales bacterium]